MTVRLTEEGVILLEGACPIEDAEPLLQRLLAHPSATVDWRDCDTAHTAVVQILVVAKVTPLGPPLGAGLQRWVEPHLLKTHA